MPGKEVIEVIEDARVEKGWTKAELARRSGILYDNLWASLKGYRKIPANEFIELCTTLDLGVEDFSGQ